jgi:hypothetical protein
MKFGVGVPSGGSRSTSASTPATRTSPELEWGEGGTVETIEPFGVYHVTEWYEQLPLVPYFGLSYLHRWASPGLYVPEALGLRAGLEYTILERRVPVIIGGGITWNHPLAECGFNDCTMYGKNREEIGPELFAVVGF